MASANALRAGKAVIEMGIKDETAKGLKGVSARIAKVTAKFAPAIAAATAFAGAATAVAGALSVAAKKFADMGSELADMNQRTGMSVESLSALKYAAEQSGASLADVGKGAQGMAKFLLLAEQGGAGAADVMRRLGVSIDDLQDLTPDQKFMKLAAAVAAVEDPTERAALAAKVFGRAGVTLLPLLNEGPKGLANLTKEAEALGLVMSEEDAAAAEKFGDALAEVEAQINALIRNVGELVANSGLLDWISSTVKELNFMVEAFQTLGKLKAFQAFMSGKGPIIVDPGNNDPPKFDGSGWYDPKSAGSMGVGSSAHLPGQMAGVGMTAKPSILDPATFGAGPLVQNKATKGEKAFGKKFFEGAHGVIDNAMVKAQAAMMRAQFEMLPLENWIGGTLGKAKAALKEFQNGQGVERDALLDATFASQHFGGGSSPEVRELQELNAKQDKLIAAVRDSKFVLRAGAG